VQPDRGYSLITDRRSTKGELALWLISVGAQKHWRCGCCCGATSTALSGLELTHNLCAARPFNASGPRPRKAMNQMTVRRR